MFLIFRECQPRIVFSLFLTFVKYEARVLIKLFLLKKECNKHLDATNKTLKRSRGTVVEVYLL